MKRGFVAIASEFDPALFAFGPATAGLCPSVDLCGYTVVCWVMWCIKGHIAARRVTPFGCFSCTVLILFFLWWHYFKFLLFFHTFFF